MTIKQIIKGLLPARVLAFKNKLDDLERLAPLADRCCPVCGYVGHFDIWFGPDIIRDNTCPRCDSHPRLRLFWLWFAGAREKMVEPILHFAPERALRERLSAIYQDYRTADLSHDAHLKLNIEAIDLPSESVETVICNHVLEHVDDTKAMRELHRILRPGGRLICSVPLIEGWSTTYENDAVASDAERALHFGQSDHVRFYGQDFRERLRRAGFTGIDEITAHGPEVVKYSLLRGEKFFLCAK
ncbi:MAG: methyltransferase domain-containing protein [Burkholderiaceae bacterium]